MQVISQRLAPQAYLPARDVVCPCCEGKLVRERRRIVDRLRSLIRPVKRYRCENFACQWIGNIGNTNTDKSGIGLVASEQPPIDKSRRTSGVPVAFVVHMILVAVGLIFVFVYSTMEPAPSFDEIEHAVGNPVQQ